MDPRWDEEAMLKRELAKLHTGEERRLKKRWMTSWVRNGNPANTSRQLRGSVIILGLTFGDESMLTADFEWFADLQIKTSAVFGVEWHLFQMSSWIFLGQSPKRGSS